MTEHETSRFARWLGGSTMRIFLAMLLVYGISFATTFWVRDHDKNEQHDQDLALIHEIQKVSRERCEGSNENRALIQGLALLGGMTQPLDFPNDIVNRIQDPGTRALIDYLESPRPPSGSLAELQRRALAIKYLDCGPGSKPPPTVVPATVP